MALKYLIGDISVLGSTSSANLDRELKFIWDLLHDQFPNPKVTESAIKRKLAKFSKLGTKDKDKSYEVLDIVSEIDSLKGDLSYSVPLADFDSSSGVTRSWPCCPTTFKRNW